ncbi:hypothetical protein BKA66DRAFT_439739 [Pyrenochaeta sp. MPI-SDFR-AT-0127]|nr:hypothetical protein BKA66DRAFT_439739 [Pyrenochaeta sp. MPI-SDFR-AT-0127]
MNHVRATRLIWRRSTASRRSGRTFRRTYATEPPPLHSPSSRSNSNSEPKEPSRVGAYYKSFGSPVLKSFLGALFTYQIIYYAWMKLETIEEQHDKNTEIKDLQQELREAILEQRQVAQKKASQAVDAMGEAKDKVLEIAREGADDAVKASGAVGKVAKGGWWPW